MHSEQDVHASTYTDVVWLLNHVDFSGIRSASTSALRMKVMEGAALLAQGGGSIAGNFDTMHFTAPIRHLLLSRCIVRPCGSPKPSAWCTKRHHSVHASWGWLCMQMRVVLSQQPYQEASAPRIYLILRPISINPALVVILGSEYCTDALLPVGDLLPVLTGPS